MANAKVIEVKKSTVELNLTVHEAEILLEILGTVSGCPFDSYRKTTQGIYNALDEAKVRHKAVHPYGRVEGTLSYPDEINHLFPLDD